MSDTIISVNESHERRENKTDTVKNITSYIIPRHKYRFIQF